MFSQSTSAEQDDEVSDAQDDLDLQSSRQDFIPTYNLENLLNDLTESEAIACVNQVLDKSSSAMDVLSVLPVDESLNCNKLPFPSKFRLLKGTAILSENTPEEKNLYKKTATNGLASLSIEELYHLQVLLPPMLKIKEHVQSEILGRYFSAESNLFLVSFMIGNLDLFKCHFVSCYFSSTQFEEDLEGISIAELTLKIGVLSEMKADENLDTEERTGKLLELRKSPDFQNRFFSAAKKRSEVINQVLAPILPQDVSNIAIKGYDSIPYHFAVFNKVSVKKESEASSSTTVEQPLEIGRKL